MCSWGTGHISYVPCLRGVNERARGAESIGFMALSGPEHPYIHTPGPYRYPCYNTRAPGYTERRGDLDQKGPKVTQLLNITYLAPF